MAKKSTGVTFNTAQVEGKPMGINNPVIDTTTTTVKQGVAEMSSKKDTAMTSVLKPRHDA